MEHRDERQQSIEMNAKIAETNPKKGAQGDAKTGSAYKGSQSNLLNFFFFDAFLSEPSFLRTLRWSRCFDSPKQTRRAKIPPGMAVLHTGYEKSPPASVLALILSYDRRTDYLCWPCCFCPAPGLLGGRSGGDVGPKGSESLADHHGR